MEGWETLPQLSFMRTLLHIHISFRHICDKWFCCLGCHSFNLRPLDHHQLPYFLFQILLTVFVSSFLEIMGGKRSQPSVVNPAYTPKSYSSGGYKSFRDFYPFYLGEHCHRTNRRLHLIGTTNSMILLLLAIFLAKPILLLVAAIQGYAFAWVGHFLFERNRPATFKHPVYSLMGDLKLWYEVISGARVF